MFWTKSESPQPPTITQRRARLRTTVSEGINDALAGSFDKRGLIFGLADDLEAFSRELRARMTR